MGSRICLSLLSAAVTNALTKNNVRGMGGFNFIANNPSLQEVKAGTRGSYLAAGPEVESTEGCYLLPCSSRFTQPAFL